VSFAIFSTPVQLSSAQIQAIATAIGFENNRPVQPVNGRPVFVNV
jgi:carbonic anhydrase